MKSRSKALTYQVTPVTLYRDELEAIVTVMRRNSECLTVKTEDYELDSLDELTELRSDRVRLSISVSNPHVSLTLDNSRNYLYAGDDGPVARGIFESVKEILDKHRSLLGRTFSHPLSAVVGIVFVILSFLIESLVPRAKDSVAWAFLALGAVWIVMILRYSFSANSVVYTAFRSERPSFARRNSDQIWIALIAAVIGGAITLLAQKVFG